MPTTPTTDHAAVLDELSWRGQIHQATDPAPHEALRAHLAQPRRIYCGFDPTADSLTIGNLVPIMMLKRFRDAGHTPIVLMGGATGRIGDPSGKDAERSLQTEEQVETNIAAQRPIFENILGAEVEIVNNYDWFRDISFIDALRDIGKHFSVNAMLARDAVKNRLEREEGISYTEFSYMLLQAYDFLHLYDNQHVTVQCAGADQWGNIVSGADLVRRARGLNDDNASKAFGLTAPLLTKSDGGKFGKTEAGAVWLSPERTSPYAFYQFWINADDADMEAFLRTFTDITQDELAALMRAHAEAPHTRQAQTYLAEHVTRLVHKDAGLASAQATTQTLFSGDVNGLDARTIDEAFAGVPTTDHSRAELEGDGLPLVDLLPQTSLASSKREAREFLASGAVTINGDKPDPDRALTPSDLLHDRYLLIKRGKKKWHVTRWA
jgi:tyrosyl-tRNA synthetase